MNRTATAYLLDPPAAVFRTVALEIGDGFEAVKSAVGSDAVDHIPFDTRHILFFDDEGLRDGITHYTVLNGHPDPLVGILVILASDPDRSEPDISMEEALARFQCYRAVMDPIIEASSHEAHGGKTFISAVTGFTPRIELATITIVREILG